jgi:hypothetical protein
VNLPINCPTCGKVLLTEYSKHSGSETILKTCYSVDHYIKFAAHAESNIVYEIIIRLSTTYPMKHVKWLLGAQMVRVEYTRVREPGDSTYTKTVTTYLPWWEPDLTNYSKLVEKVKTYLLFS